MVAKTYLSDHRSSIMNCASWALIAIYILYLKNYAIFRSFFGVVQDVTYENLTPTAIDNITDILFFYAPDIGLILVVIVLFVVSHKYVTRQFLIPIQCVLCTITIILLYANQHSWGTVGQYLNYPSAMVAVSFLFEAPTTASSYFDQESLMIIGSLIVLVNILTVFNDWLARLWLFSYIIVPAFLIVVSLLLVIIFIGLFSKMDDYPIAGGYLQKAVLEILPTTFDGSADDFKESENTENTVVKFGTNQDDELALNGRVFEPATDNDLIVFVLETAAAKFMPLQGDLDDFPSIKEISNNSLIALQHYSTFPASSESIASIFSGNYPPRSYYQTCLMSNAALSEGTMPGIVADLARSGIRTGIYAPFQPKVPLDAMWNSRSGFDEIFYANVHDNISDRVSDEAALDKMMMDIDRWIDNGQRYATFFFPQLGHGPWVDRKPGTTVIEHGKLLAQYQDNWIGEIIELLKKNGKLDTTTIVVTGDHGIRTSEEDPDFVPGKISDYTFHVPLFIFSKKFEGTNYISAPTSHVDLAPTLVDLLSLNSRKDQYQGIPLWHADRSDREVYLPATWYYGADGYYSEGDFYMWSSTLGIFYKSDDMEFQNKDIVYDNEIKMGISNKIRLFNKIQWDRVEDICQTNFPALK